MNLINRVHYCQNAVSTKRLAKRIARILKPGDWLGLTGELGSGKTTFVKGLAEGLGVRDLVQSPTFVIAREYSGKTALVHIDLYRLSDKEVDALGLEDYCSGGAVVAVEWAEKLPAIFKRGIYWLEFKVESGCKRSVKFSRTECPPVCYCKQPVGPLERKVFKGGKRQLPARG